jgi:transcription elongation factor Elf1
MSTQNKNNQELLQRRVEELIGEFSEKDILNYIFEYFSDDASEIFLKRMDDIIKANYPGSNELLNDLSRFLLKKELTGELKCPGCGNDKIKVHKTGYRETKKYGNEISWFCELCGNAFGVEKPSFFTREVFSIEKWRNEVDTEPSLPIKKNNQE